MAGMSLASRPVSCLSALELSLASRLVPRLSSIRSRFSLLASDFYLSFLPSYLLSVILPFTQSSVLVFPVFTASPLHAISIRALIQARRNPLGCAVAITALDVLQRENLAERSQYLGEIFRSEIFALKSPFVKLVRGRGLFNGVVIDETKSRRGRTAWQLCLLMKSKG